MTEQPERPSFNAYIESLKAEVFTVPPTPEQWSILIRALDAHRLLDPTAREEMDRIASILAAWHQDEA